MIDYTKKNKLFWIDQFIFYDYSMFVVWRIVNDKRKNRIIIDIQNLNKINMFNAYSISLQFDIFFVVMNAFYINVMNCVSFFHQWLIRVLNRHKLIVVNHRNSKQWNVTMINYRNSLIYVQRQINFILKNYRHFVKIYVDDIVVFFNSLKKHLRHFNQIFILFKRMNIALKFIKTFLKYFTISLLNQRVNSLNLIIVTNKLKIILNLIFS